MSWVRRLDDRVFHRVLGPQANALMAARVTNAGARRLGVRLSQLEADLVVEQAARLAAETRVAELEEQLRRQE